MVIARDKNGSGATKWWGRSVTIWGALVTAAATVLPVLAPLVGLEIGADTIHKIGADTLSVIQVLVGLAGTAMAIFGRLRATQVLVQRSMSFKL